MIDLGGPSKSSGRQNASLNRPSGAKKQNKIKDGATWGGSWKLPFPESIWIEGLMICCKFMIDLGSLFCNFVKSIDELLLFWAHVVS